MKAGKTTLGRPRRLAAMALAAAVLTGVAPASRAQLGDVLKNPMGGGAGGTAESAAGALGGLGGGLSLQSLSSGSMGNVAGLLDFCIKNNYLGAGGAASVKDKLMDKLGGPAKASTDSGYGSGTRGILQDSHGKTLDLSGSGLKAKATEQVCEKVLSQGKSLL
ncbi:hypothetical protein LMG31506_03573 [Cupriavidus yeoncheonensis]|uniref:DUF2501 domain-containing protein n=1 Tax=Cupriavidus yeoncheonensis TaxID=1462994 RepID=A0A916MYM6_9BURK|nr:DUF2501 domain-containing protein [Cupriavidus yeoncheonensis]CAG2147222.1 hypothetical protein LMG31506_03573 [Cupriavidus yeoncheonensis]